LHVQEGLTIHGFEEIAKKWHKFYKGKISVNLKHPIRSYHDFAIVYTPGVAEPSKEIFKDPDKVFDYTNKPNFVAVVSDGSRVLGLGNIGPHGSLPVLEGKAVLFKYLADVDAFPVALDTQDPDEIIAAVKWMSPTFGGINLEDIASPKCFYVLEKLVEELDIFVWHDDQQGTATVILAGVINALKLVGKKISEIQIAMIGAGAAGLPTTKLLVEAGAQPGNIFVVDRGGILNTRRFPDLNKYKQEVAGVTNKEEREGGIAEAIKGVDLTISISKPGPGVITKEMVSSMADDAIVFALANPVPEISPKEAKEGGARIVATGRSDYPNQVNNSLGFPAIIRGSLDVMAPTINVDMQIAAAEELARFSEGKGISEDYITPKMSEFDVFPLEAAAVARAAIKSGMARIKVDPDEILEDTQRRVEKYHKILNIITKEGLFDRFPE